MFTGIIEEMGTILQREPAGLVIQAAQVLQGIETKDSIAVDGACLTVTGRGEDWFRVDVMPETFRCTRLGSLQPGSHVNLERSLLSDGRIGGHLVQGHVEATARVLSIQEDGIAHTVEIELPEQLRPFVIPKCFIAVNGVSLTVIERLQSSFSLALIPYTKQHTNLGDWHIAQSGDRYHRKVRGTSSGADRHRGTREWERDRRDRHPRYR